MKFKFITMPHSYRDPYAQSLDADAVAEIVAAAGKIGIKLKIVDRVVYLKRGTMFEVREKKAIKELSFECPDGVHPEWIANQVRRVAPRMKNGFRIERWSPRADEIIEILNKCKIDARVLGGVIFFETRDNGDIGRERPGKLDIEFCQRGAKAVREKYPTLTVSIDTTDEWVNLSIDMTDIDNAEQVEAQQMNPQP